MTQFAALRACLPVARRWAYFDHAAVAPLPEPAAQALRQWLDEAVADGDACWPRWEQGAEQTRAAAAAMLGASPDEIALAPNTSAGIGLVAEGFPWRPGDNVVTLANEFPANIYPWLNLADRGVETRLAPVDQGVVDWNRLAEACDARTRLVAVSWVGFASGHRLDVSAAARVAHDHGALLLLDAIQGLGVFPLDVAAAGVDFLAADGHKWLLGPEGAGLFYLRRQHLSLLRPLLVGWNSVRRPYDFSRLDFDLRPAAARYEGGSRNMAGLLALGASLNLLRSHGLAPDASPLADRVLELAAAARRRLEALGAELVYPSLPGHGSGIVTFRLPDENPAEVRRRCLERRVALSCRDGALRISPHAYNNEDDLDRLCAALKR